MGHRSNSQVDRLFDNESITNYLQFFVLAENWLTLHRCYGQTGQRIEKRIDGILTSRTCAQLIGYEPIPPVHGGGISYIWSFWGS